SSITLLSLFRSEVSALKLTSVILSIKFLISLRNIVESLDLILRRRPPPSTSSRRSCSRSNFLTFRHANFSLRLFLLTLWLPSNKFRQFVQLIFFSIFRE